MGNIRGTHPWQQTSMYIHIKGIHFAFSWFTSSHMSKSFHWSQKRKCSKQLNKKNFMYLPPNASHTQIMNTFSKIQLKPHIESGSSWIFIQKESLIKLIVTKFEWIRKHPKRHSRKYEMSLSQEVGKTRWIGCPSLDPLPNC